MDEPRQGEYRARLNGVDLWYRISGSGPICLAPSPAWGPSSDYLFRSLEPLDAWFTMVYVDTRGAGRSERPASSDAYSWECLTADLEALRRHLQRDRIWLMGHSYAGPQVMQYALAHPEQVEGLILLATHAADDAEYQEDMAARRQARSNEPWYAAANSGWEMDPQSDEELARMLQTILPFYFVDQGNLERSAPVFSTLTASIRAWQSAGQRSPFDLTDRLPEIRVPTLIVVGSGDFICSPRQAQRLHRGIPNSKLLLIEDAGHFPWMEQPEAFYDGIAQFLPVLGYR